MFVHVAEEKDPGRHSAWPERRLLGHDRVAGQDRVTHYKLWSAEAPDLAL